MIPLATIIQLLHPEADLTKDITLVNHGGGVEIEYWDEDRFGPRPTIDELLAQSSVVAGEYEDQNIRQARRDNYMPIGDQLDALWHAMDQGILPKIEPIYTTHKNVKETHKKKGV
jgi:hypothetical protein